MGGFPKVSLRSTHGSRTVKQRPAIWQIDHKASYFKVCLCVPKSIIHVRFLDIFDKKDQDMFVDTRHMPCVFCEATMFWALSSR